MNTPHIQRKLIDRELKEQEERDREWKKQHGAAGEAPQSTTHRATDEPTSPREETDAMIVLCQECGHRNVVIRDQSVPAAAASRRQGAGDKVLLPPVMKVAGGIKPFKMSSWISDTANAARKEKGKGVTGTEKDMPKVVQYYCSASERQGSRSGLRRSSSLSKSMEYLSRREC